MKGSKNTKNYEINFSPLTSTSPPFSTTSLNSLNKSNVCFAIIGTLFTGVPINKKIKIQISKGTYKLLKSPAAILNTGGTKRREILQVKLRHVISNKKSTNQLLIRLTSVSDSKTAKSPELCRTSCIRRK